MLRRQCTSLLDSFGFFIYRSGTPHSMRGVSPGPNSQSVRQRGKSEEIKTTADQLSLLQNRSLNRLSQTPYRFSSRTVTLDRSGMTYTRTYIAIL